MAREVFKVLGTCSTSHTSIKGSFAKSFNHLQPRSHVKIQNLQSVYWWCQLCPSWPGGVCQLCWARGVTPHYTTKQNLLLRCKPLVPINTSQQGDPSGYQKKETSKLYRVPGPSLPQGYTVHLHSDCLCFGLGIRSSAFGGKVSHIATGHT